MEKNNIVPCAVSILLVTYNHEKYIGQALDSLFNQVLEGPVELVVADDGSTDGTLSIIREFEARQSGFVFKYLDNRINLGITRNYERGFAACTGKYVAVLEGDDYWCSPFKLQMQLNFLDRHWECNLCSVNYFVYEEGRCAFTPRTTIGANYRLLSARDLIADNVVGNFSTCMYRKSALDALPPRLFDITSYDWIINICVARNSLIGFIEEPLSVYRLHSHGVWTQTPHVKKLQTQLDLIPAYDDLTNRIFHDEFECLGERLRHVIGAARIESGLGVAARPIAKALPGVSDYLPPLFMILARAILPPKLKRLVSRIVLRRSA